MRERHLSYAWQQDRRGFFPIGACFWVPEAFDQWESIVWGGWLGPWTRSLVVRWKKKLLPSPPTLCYFDCTPYGGGDGGDKVAVKPLNSLFIWLRSWCNGHGGEFDSTFLCRFLTAGRRPVIPTPSSPRPGKKPRNFSLSPSLIRTLCGPRSDEEQDGFSRTRCLMGGKETSSSSASPPSLVWDCLLWPVCKTRFLVSFMGFWFSFPVGSFFFVGLALVRFRPGGCFQSISPLWSRSVFLGASCRSYWANCLQKRGILLLFIMLDRNLGVDSVQNNSFFFFHHADWLSI